MAGREALKHSVSCPDFKKGSCNFQKEGKLMFDFVVKNFSAAIKIKPLLHQFICLRRRAQTFL